eukprot:12650532-Alexandrium_andersonii.AAC.1
MVPGLHFVPSELNPADAPSHNRDMPARASLAVPWRARGRFARSEWDRWASWPRQPKRLARWALL